MILTRAVLLDVKKRCLRKRVWFGSLSSIERSLLDLTIRVVDEVRSSKLASILGGIMYRLEEALENKFMRKVLEIGNVLAERFARLAHSWGNVRALDWIRDKGYVLYLGICQMNCSRMFRSAP